MLERAGMLRTDLSSLSGCPHNHLFTSRRTFLRPYRSFRPSALGQCSSAREDRMLRKLHWKRYAPSEAKYLSGALEAGSLRTLLPSCRHRVASRCIASCVARAAAAAPAKAEPTPTDSPRAAAYPFTKIEQKWQRHWREHKTFRTPDLGELDTSKPKFYALDMCAISSPGMLSSGRLQAVQSSESHCPAAPC